MQPLERRVLLAAFPGATGPAMNATGGRGGDIYHVTNLTDSATNPQPGSLRYGIVTAPSSGRTIVFDVGGTIKLSPPGRQGWLTISRDNLTIAGQTAPGSGITIMGQATKVTGNNIIIRHIKFRPGQDQQNPGVATNDALWLTGNNIIVDHVSASWYDDEGISASDGAGNITVQYAILGNALNYNGHGYGGLIGSDVPNSQIAYHHILYAHHKSRLPRLGNETSIVNYVDFSNNVIYNWSRSVAGYSGSGQYARANFVNNTYIYGASPGTTIFESGGANTHIYQSGNKLDIDRDGTLNDGRDVTWSDFAGTETQVSTRFNVPNLSYESAATALNNTLDRAGAFWWARDAIDTRLVHETRTGTGDVINLPDSTEWNNLWNAPQVNRPSGWDTDGDGMPNAWELANGFNPNVADHNGDADGDGYRNIEEYLDYAAQGSPAVDTTAPTSSVAPLPAMTTSTSFTVSWSGSDNPGGSGLKSYDIYVKVNGDSTMTGYTKWLSGVTTTSATFNGAAGNTYRFYSRARDNANNIEPTPTAADATTTVVAATPAAAWWKMDETSGTTITDSSGNGRHGTLNGATRVAGVSGNGLSFDGADDYVTLPTSIAGSSTGTIAMWVRTATDFANLAHLFYTSSVSNGDGLGSHAELHLNFNANEQLQFFIEGGTADVNITSPASYANNAWHHVAATWDVNGNAVLYVDGSPVGSVVHDAAVFTGSAITYLGRPGASVRYYSGLMDEVRLYAVALSADEIAALAGGGLPPGFRAVPKKAPARTGLFSSVSFADSEQDWQDPISL